MKNIGFSFKRVPPIFFLVLIFVAIFLINYTPGTWLSGWDNVMPELNPLANLKRAFFGVWQEYQGLGLLAGMGHASDLFRQVFLWLLSFILPANFLRYFFHFLMLFTGSLGVFFLIKNFILEKFNDSLRSWGAFVGGLFYLLNLATLQTFYVPLEVCSVHFAFLPWLFFGVFNFLKNKGRKGLLLLTIINLLAVAQGVVITFFFVYFLALAIVLTGTFLLNHKLWKRILVVYLLTFCLNAFWLLPNLYFVAKNVSTNLEAKINIMSTEDIFLKNKKYGNFENVMLLKGFWFSNLENNNMGTGDLMMRPWANHLEKQYILGVGYLLFALSIFGIFAAIKAKNKSSLLFLPVLLFGFIFLANDTPVLSLFAKWLYKLPLFLQIFRFPFMKFSTLTAFCLAIFYSVGFSFLVSAVRVKKFFKIFTFIIFVTLPIIFLYPVFQGKLFFAKERVKIPEEYFQVFDFFKSQDKNTRIANFPQPTFWGWTNYRWGYYSGSGFLWYGIEQPILDRAFDPWSGYNENYYWEISYALYSKNQELFEKVLEKYQVSWLLVDGNVIDPSSAKALFFDELEAILGDKKDVISNKQSLIQHNKKKFELAAEFGKIKIYKVNLKTLVKDFVWMAEGLPVINSYDWGNLDGAYNEMGNYVSPSSEKLIANSEELKLKTQNSDPKYLIQDTKYNTYYPFRSLFTGRTTNDLDFEIEDKGDKFVFKKSLPKGIENYNLVIPQYKGDELVEVDKTDLTKVRYFIPTASVVGNIVEVVVPKVGGIFSAEIDPTQVPEVLTAKNCNQFSGGRVSNSIVGGFEGGGEKTLRLEAGDANNCSASFWLPDLPNKYGYLISAETKNISGKPLLFWVENLTNRKADMELYLRKQEAVNSEQSRATTDFLIQPPMAEDGLGYTLHFDNISIGRKQTINDLGKISVNPIPYKFLSSLKLINQDSRFNDLNHFNETAGGVNVSDLQGVIASHLEVNHPNPAVYEVKIDGPTPDNATLVLSRAFHQGWKAYNISLKFKVQSSKLIGLFPFIFGEEIKEHVIVNNWENGWNINKLKIQNSKFKIADQNSKVLDDGTIIILVFWPQWLEYVGFVLLGLSFVEVLIILKGNLDVKSEM